MRDRSRHIKIPRTMSGVFLCEGPEIYRSDLSKKAWLLMFRLRHTAHPPAAFIFGFKAKPGNQRAQLGRFAGEHCRGVGRLLYHCGVLLCALIHGIHRCIDFGKTRGLFGCRGGDGIHVSVYAGDPLADVLERRSRIEHEFDPAFDFRTGLADACGTGPGADYRSGGAVAG